MFENFTKISELGREGRILKNLPTVFSDKFLNILSSGPAISVEKLVPYLSEEVSLYDEEASSDYFHRLKLKCFDLTVEHSFFLLKEEKPDEYLFLEQNPELLESVKVMILGFVDIMLLYDTMKTAVEMYYILKSQASMNVYIPADLLIQVLRTLGFSARSISLGTLLYFNNLWNCKDVSSLVEELTLKEEESGALPYFSTLYTEESSSYQITEANEVIDFVNSTLFPINLI